MKLCHNCRHIPFENPPSLPRSYIHSLPGLPETDDLFLVEYRDPQPHPYTLGYHHHQSQDELRQSAQGCNLCHLIFHEFRRIVKHAPRPIADYRFYITRREGHQEGFVVWTFGERGDIWRVGAYRYSVEDEDPLSGVFKGRYVDDSKSANAQKLAKRWIHHCTKHHTSLCGPPRGSNTPLPKRVIDLGPPSSTTFKLLETNGKKGLYVTLSYTWGPPPHPYQTTRNNLKAYESGIKFSGRKPQTILDAIEITRQAGIQYLWIDAICIIQGGDPEIVSESAKMADYYGNAYFTISAAASPSAYDGIFQPRQSPSSTDIPYTSDNNTKGRLTIFALNPFKENIQMRYLSFEDDSIATRGWTLQERILSTRIIHYASDQMYYECNTHFLGEDGFQVQGRQSSADPRTREISLFGTKKEKPRDMWDILVQDYGARSLTKADDDKFVAFSGLAQKFGTLFRGDQYIAGLWKNQLTEYLFWVVNPDSEHKRQKWSNAWPPATYRAPSWSWACLDVSTLNPDGRIYGADIYTTCVDHVTLSDNRYPYGKISDAYLTVHTPKLIHLQLKSHTRHDPKWSVRSDANEKTVSVEHTTTLDYHFSSGELENLDVHALTLARDTLNGEDNVFYLCLLVTRVTGHGYRRMGVVFLKESALGQHSPEKSDRTHIRLV